MADPGFLDRGASLDKGVPVWIEVPPGQMAQPEIKKKWLACLKGIYPEFQVIRGFSQKILADLLSYDQIHS